jgi:VWFA-related protein
MVLLFRCLLVSLVTLSLALLIPAQQPVTTLPPSSAQTLQEQNTGSTIRIRSDEVLLDVIVRDKKGRPVRDLKPAEIEVYENGVRQTVNALQLIESAAVTDETGKASTKNVSTARQYVPLDPARQINLVTMVFDNMDINGKKLAREAALDFLNNSLNANVMVSIFVVSNGFHIVQPFTGNLEKLRQAIESITARSEIRYADLSQKITEQLEIVINAPDFAPPVPPGAAIPANNPAGIPLASAGLAPSTGLGTASSPIDKAMAKVTLSTLRAIQEAQIEQQARASIFAFLHVAREQRRLGGRKTVLYFANGLIVPMNLKDLLQTTISEANRANVTFYALDTRGLSVDSVNAAGLQAMALAIQGSREAQADGPVGIGQGTVSDASFKSAEIAENSTRMNKQGTLAELAESTGGFLISNTNDLRQSLRRVTQELSSYYALAYTPASAEPDGKFRQVTVKSLRPDVRVQTRSGYFALPAMDGKPVMGYEMPLLAAANKATPPSDFAHESALLRFKPGPQESQQILLAAVPLSEITFKQDTTRKLYEVHLAVLGLVRDSQGRIVRRVSQDFPLQGKWSRVESLKKGNLDFSQSLTLPPGNYTLQTIVHDFQSSHTSVRTRPISIPPLQPDLALSSLTIIKSLDSANIKASEEKPLQTAQGRIVPLLSESVKAEKAENLSFFLTAYLPAGTKDAPPLGVELQCDGQVISRGEMPLPLPDDTGRVQHVFSIPLKPLRSGSYLARALIRRGEKQIVTEATFTLDNPGYVASAKSISPDSAPKPADTKILSANAEENKPPEDLPPVPAVKTVGLSERVLTLTRATAESGSARAAAVNIPELLAETERSGVTLHQSLLKYTYQLRKVRHVLNEKGEPTKEEFQDYEAYPVRGQHVLIQTTNNEGKLTSSEIEQERRRAVFWLESAERNHPASSEETRNKRSQELPGYVTASINGSYRGKAAGLLIDPTIFLHYCDFSDPRYEMLHGREMIALDFTPRQGADLPAVRAFVTRLTGTIWIDSADRVLVRLEAYNLLPGPDKNGKPLPVSPDPKLVYQQSKQPTGEWFPAVIRLNADGDASAFFGLNWDVAFEFAGYQQFGATGEQSGDVKVKKKPEMEK